MIEIVQIFQWYLKLNQIQPNEWLTFSVVTADGHIGPLDKLWWASTDNGQIQFRVHKQGRFAPGKSTKAAYLASDISINISETDPLLREDTQLTLNKIIASTNPTHRNISRCFHLKSNVNLLDLTSSDCKFIKSLINHNIISNSTKFYQDIISSRKKDCYPITRAISRKAFKSGFHGIIWKSVRQPIDSNVASSECILLFHNFLVPAVD